MKSKILCLLLVLLTKSFLYSQAPNDANLTPLSGVATAANKQVNTPVNYYTGIPSISFPIYSYKNPNGLNLNISLDYIGGGGIRVNETPSPVGLGWNLNAGGIITRAVGGRPDDLPNGYINAPNLPTDYRTNATKYYYDTLDAEQDVFQFSVNGRGGKFFIGKNKQIVMIPISKLKIGFATGTNGQIASFTITAEDGTKYVFGEIESEVLDLENIPGQTDDFRCGYNKQSYANAWHLSCIMAPLGVDSIQLKYSSTSYQNEGYNYPQSVYMRNNNPEYRYSMLGLRDRSTKKIASILFPDKKRIDFVYDRLFRYDGKDSVLDRIKISDSVFRYGYLLNWNDGENYTLLNGLQFFTAKATKAGYKFFYSSPLLPVIGKADNSFKIDHWGYYNGAENGDPIPSVLGIYDGADRNPSPTLSKASSLSHIIDPSGGITYYQFEPNETPEYSPTSIQDTGHISNILVNTETNVHLYQESNLKHVLKFEFPYSTTGIPFPSACSLVVTIVSEDGQTTKGPFNISVNQLYYKFSLNFSAPNGNYKVRTTFSGSCSPTQPEVPLIFTWTNRIYTGNAAISGGLRIKQISHWDPSTRKTDTIATYQYLLSNGKTSGFLSSIPKYDYQFERKHIVDGGSPVLQRFVVISSSPINHLNYTQGSSIGYSRVIVYKGSIAHNLGKEIYEFSNLQDANANDVPPSFPYAPFIQRDWAMGLPKRISTYDRLGNLVKITRNTYATSSMTYEAENFLSYKLGRIGVVVEGYRPTQPERVLEELFAAQTYYPETGRSDLIAKIDSLIHPNGSIQIVEQKLEYDTNYNLVKITSPYNKSRALNLEKRIYYPYHYTFTSGPIKKLKDNGIISSMISSEDWIVGDANPRMIGSSIVDYQSLSSGHVKPLASYTLQTNAPVPQSVIGTFNPGSLVRNATYLVPQQNYLKYDQKGNLLESKNAVSGEVSSVLMDYANQFPVAQISNAANSDVAYTSFESDGTGNWTIANSSRDYANSLTGKASYNLSNGNISKSGLSVNRTYLLFVWAKTGAAVTVNGSSLNSPIAQQNNWSLYQKNITNTSMVTISGGGLIDELRLHPKDASMVTSTFEPTLGATSTTDANNTVSYYQYDDMNRLLAVRDKDLNILKKYEYDDSTSLINTTPVWQFTGTECHQPLNGKRDRIERDVNPFSLTYNTKRYLYDSDDCVSCKPTCQQVPYIKLINCKCEEGVEVCISTVKTKEHGFWEWKSTFHYRFSDCSSVLSHYEFYDATEPAIPAHPNCP